MGNIIDPAGLDPRTLRAVKDSDSKVELVFQWVQNHIVENIDTSAIPVPPPILSRVFQELANGMVQFHEVMKLTTVPFPFPYAQVCDGLLVVHAICTPFIVSQWAEHPVTATLFSFLTVTTFWALNIISVEIENPFGSDANDLEAGDMQDDMNRYLMLLVSEQSRRVPTLTERAVDLFNLYKEEVFEGSSSLNEWRSALADCWKRDEEMADFSVMKSYRSRRKNSIMGTFSSLPSQRRSKRKSDSSANISATESSSSQRRNSRNSSMQSLPSELDSVRQSPRPNPTDLASVRQPAPADLDPAVPAPILEPKLITSNASVEISTCAGTQKLAHEADACGEGKEIALNCSEHEEAGGVQTLSWPATTASKVPRSGKSERSGEGGNRSAWTTSSSPRQ